MKGMSVKAPLMAALFVIAGTAFATAANHDPANCRTTNSPVVVDLDNQRHRHILDHAWDAIRGDEQQSVPRSRDGQPEPVVLHIDRTHATAHRTQSLRGIPTQPGYDRDEYAPAMSAEGGTGADVRYVLSSENRSAGVKMGSQLVEYCDGQAFRFEMKSG